MIRHLVLAATLALAACQPGPRPPAPVASIETARGAFEGASGHVTTGHATVFRAGGRWYVRLDEDFTFDGAPDPKVALGHDGFRQDAIIAPLAGNSGAQVYELPATLDVADYNEVWIWCEQFAVPLGVAKLTLL